MSTDEPKNPSPEPERLSHIDAAGRATMVDVGSKPLSHRTAVAECLFQAQPSTIDAVMVGNLPKGEALGVARIAGIQAAKRTDALIPLCHTLPLNQVTVSFIRESDGAIRISASANVTARTGVEMEALTAAAVAALTLYDMTKAIDRDLRIDGLRLVSKTKQTVASTQANDASAS